MPSGLGLALSALVWLVPSVLPLPSRTGPEGPPRPLGVTPPFGQEAPPTSGALVSAQQHRLNH